MRQQTKLFLTGLLSLVICLNISLNDICAQQGGNNTWEFLNLTSSARIAALGGKNTSLRDGDLNLVFHNPALLDSTMHNHLAINYVNYFAGINFGYASWGYHNDRLGSFAAGVHYINYGKFIAADNTGLITGDFSAGENSVNISWSTGLDSLFSFGATVKGIVSSFEQYGSAGVAIDAGINYFNPAHKLSASLVLKNLGTQISTWYSGAEREPLPFELQLGLTKQLTHAPFRFSLVYQHLQDFRLNDEKNHSVNNTGSSTNGSSRVLQIGNELLRHIILGVEFIPSGNFSLMAGYNNLRRHELKIEERVSTVGFSWGFGVRVNRFMVSFGQARYHLAGSSGHFSVTTNLSSFYTR